MSRLLLLAGLALAPSGSARPGAPAPPRGTFERFVRSEVVVVGKVTAIEKTTVEATLPYGDAKDKFAYTVAVVKVGTALAGASDLTHVRVGFVPPDPKAPPLRGSGGVIRAREPVPELKDGQEMLLFLVKHPTADFYVMPSMNMPYDTGSDTGKKELDVVKKFAAVLADPTNGLKSDKAGVRAETAALAVAKYRSYPEYTTKVEEVAIPADESELILKGLAEGDWVQKSWAAPPNALYGFFYLGLTEKDGWKEPVLPPAQPGKPPVDLAALQKEAFAGWLAGPGKDYRVKKIVPKK